jgi:prepilin-type N-terminal cleavage/methylation domain-containing protein
LGEGWGEGALHVRRARVSEHPGEDALHPHRATGTAVRRGFSLVELLVVIGIISVLVALVTPAVMNARKAARNASIKAEIDMLHMAIMNYKNEYGSFPPSVSGNIAFSANMTDAATKHLRRIFPRMSVPPAAPAQAQGLGYLNTGVGTAVAVGAVGIDTALVQWLFGYTTDPTAPVLSSNGQIVMLNPPIIQLAGTVLPRKKLFDFDMARITTPATSTNPWRYSPSGKPGSPYIYIDAANYPSIPYSALQLANAGAQYLPLTPLPAKPASNPPDAWYFTNINAPAASMQQFFNPDTFQILCAGDDLSNFWPGTRRQYLDSLQTQ